MNDQLAIAEPRLGSRRQGWWSTDGFQRRLFILPTVIFLLALTLFPFVYSVFLSLHHVRLTTLHRRVFAGFENYTDLLRDGVFLAAMGNTALLAVASISIEVMLGFAIAKVFHALMHRPWVHALRSAFLVPMMVTPIVIGITANYIFNPSLGVANHLLGLAGVDPVAWFGNPTAAKLTILLINVWQWTPFMALLILAGLMTIRDDIIEAARMDGARWHHIMLRIELPSVMGIVMLGIVLRLIEVLRFFDIVYVTTRGGPGDSTMVATLFTYMQNFQYFQVGLGSASAVIILVTSIIVTTFAVQILRRFEDD